MATTRTCDNVGEWGRGETLHTYSETGKNYNYLYANSIQIHTQTYNR